MPIELHLEMRAAQIISVSIILGWNDRHPYLHTDTLFGLSGLLLVRNNKIYVLDYYETYIWIVRSLPSAAIGTMYISSYVLIIGLIMIDI